MLPWAMPNKLTCMPLVFGMRQESVPPAPMTVGAAAVGGGCEPGELPGPLYVF
jgi:hypothetical protein